VCAPGCAESVRSIGTVAPMNKKPRARLAGPALRGDLSTPRHPWSPVFATNLHELGDIDGVCLTCGNAMSPSCLGYKNHALGDIVRYLDGYRRMSRCRT
jgi:hypothetical protein